MVTSTQRAIPTSHAVQAQGTTSLARGAVKLQHPITSDSLRSNSHAERKPSLLGLGSDEASEIGAKGSRKIFTDTNVFIAVHIVAGLVNLALLYYIMKGAVKNGTTQALNKAVQNGVLGNAQNQQAALNQ